MLKYEKYTLNDIIDPSILPYLDQLKDISDKKLRRVEYVRGLSKRENDTEAALKKNILKILLEAQQRTDKVVDFSGYIYFFNKSKPNQLFSHILTDYYTSNIEKIDSVLDELIDEVRMYTDNTPLEELEGM